MAGFIVLDEMALHAIDMRSSGNDRSWMLARGLAGHARLLMAERSGRPVFAKRRVEFLHWRTASRSQSPIPARNNTAADR
ncbi:hypothetical protein C9397_01520 [Xanthomonas vasicola pv. vasculorum]|uniref:Uncharacterized protein n=1 Tax=Xanthomonas vasicola pv. vasculorum TaxID=325776 RepID=A0AAE8F5J3_XANVA|nr:hypothetical protein C7V42_17270 [Xanthomonas vasicola pv. vasculorum]AZR25753.1 hypothetical protein NX80_003800 [Xanthomonas vasicola pv. arecae]AZR32250.1 hypothetical protein KWO_018855 [Xanthomonas vasicola pv. musacearum NCPPB 4379]RJL87025.1 hypothetical protein DEG03_002120 [Xanthomonas vasicola]RRJ44146.1 hypothetical protein EIM46_02455 [Xanthomonas vasicola pv. musacearum]